MIKVRCMVNVGERRRKMNVQSRRMVMNAVFEAAFGAASQPCVVMLPLLHDRAFGTVHWRPGEADGRSALLYINEQALRNCLLPFLPLPSGNEENDQTYYNDSSSCDPSHKRQVVFTSSWIHMIDRIQFDHCRSSDRKLDRSEWGMRHVFSRTCSFLPGLDIIL